MLRAQLLGGTPPELLSAITGLTESRFPVHAKRTTPTASRPRPRRESDRGHVKTLAGTTIYAQPGAPVIAVQDGEIAGLGETPALGRYISLRDAYGNTYTYAAARQRRRALPGAGAARGHRGQHADRPGGLHAPANLAAERPCKRGRAAPLAALAGRRQLGSGDGGGQRPGNAPAPAPAPPPRCPAPRRRGPRRRDAAGVPCGPRRGLPAPAGPGVQVLAGTVLGHIGAAGEPEAPATGIPRPPVPGRGSRTCSSRSAPPARARR